MTRKDICIIVPTIREYECMETYIENAREHGVDTDRFHVLLVTEDFCDTDDMEEMLDELGVDGDVFDGQARQEWFEEHGLEEYSHLIPAASHAQTSFGLLWMWMHPQYEHGVFIDDDTLPHEDFDFFGRHLDNLAFTGTETHVSSDEDWVNVLYQNFDRHQLYPRGYPYSAMDEITTEEQEQVEDVIASQGLWTNVPDLDAVRILMDGNLQGQAETLTSADDFEGNFVADEGNYLTVCSMNLAFEREVIPAFYQFPMDDNEWDVGRFDDIWSGLTLKKAADMLGKSVLTGYPLCEHNKAERSTFSDLNNEVPALELNEHFWEGLEEAPDSAEDYYDAYEKMIEGLKRYDFSDYINDDFMEFVIEHMEDWLDCLRAIEERR